MAGAGLHGPESGWNLKALSNKRHASFLTPPKELFRIAIVLGDQAVAAIEKSDLPAAMIEEIRTAKKYAEGRGLRLEVRTRGDVEHVKKLLAIKMMN